MHGVLLIFALHFGARSARDRGQLAPAAPPVSDTRDAWFSRDKAKHFFMSAFIQSVSSSMLRGTGLNRQDAVIGAALVSSGAAVGKEVYDARTGGDPSVKDIAWDAAGIAAAAAMLHNTQP